MNKSEIYNSVTDDISVSVIATYEPSHSNIERSQFAFSYEITIMNLSSFRVQLLSREWFIRDLLDGEHHVAGDGVIGLQPIIEPGESFMYSSWTPLSSTIGSMDGNYLFINLDNQKEFKVEVPRFELIAGFKKN